jgi:PAS domain S-box-containing protein
VSEGGPGFTVLLVEDHPPDVRLIREELTALSVPIEFAVESSLSSALARLDSDGFDCVLAGHHLMGGDVRSSIGEIRGRDPSACVILLFEFDDPEVVSTALATGAQDCLDKAGLDGEALLRAIQYGVARQTAPIAPVPAGAEKIDVLLPILEPVVRSMPFAVAAVDNEAKVLLWNPASEELYGWAADEVLGKPLPTFPDEEAVENFRKLLGSRGEGTVLLEFETIRQRKDGSLVHVSVSTAPLLDVAGDPIGMIGFSADITTRVQTEADMRDSEERFRSIFEHSNDAIFILDPEKDEFLEINRRAAEMLGYRVDELTSLHPSDIHPDQMPQLQTFAKVVFERGHGWTRDLTCRTKSGDRLPSEISASIISLEGRAWMIAVVRDISAQRQAEEQLARAQRELEHRAGQLSRTEAELSDYARAVSHDLSEPLRTISSYIQLLEQRYHDQLDEDATEFIGFTVDAVKRMRLLLADLLALSTIGASARAFSDVDTAKVVDEVTHDLAAGIAEAGAVVKVGSLPVVSGDRREIAELFQNLIGNALKFRSAERPLVVNVSAVAEDGTIRFAVADNGVGIDPVHQERVFGVFRRLHPPGEYPGTGIGLAICKKVIDRHGGRIWVESRDNEGSTFYFTIPDR